MNKCEEERERIRATFLEKIKDSRARIIMSSSFTANPEFEEKYLEEIKKDPYLFGLYKKWIISVSPYPFPKDTDLYKLRDIILRPLEKGKFKPLETYKHINKPAFYLLLDFLKEFILDEAMDGMWDYYFNLSELPEKEKEELQGSLGAIIKPTLIQALSITDKESNEKEGYPSLINAWVDKLKYLIFSNLNIEYFELPEDNESFILAFEEEWTKLYKYSDSFYGFNVVPLVDPTDWIRYLKMPFKLPKFKRLSSSKYYKEVMNYVASFATVKPVPVLDIKVFFRRELAQLYKPLINNSLRKYHNHGNKFSEKQLEEIINDEFRKMVRDFQFFYKSTKDIQKKEHQGQSLLAPIGYGGHLAQPGHIYNNNEYPFTAYIKEKLENRLRTYFVIDKDGFSFEFDDKKQYASPWDTGNIPDYDFVNEEGKPIGWMILTFASILGKNERTLRRWDEKKLLVAKRYGRYGKYKRNKYQYRYYTKEDRGKAKEVEELMIKRKQHKI